MLSAFSRSVAVQKAVGTFAVFWLSQCQPSDPGVVVLGDLGALPRAEITVLASTVLSNCGGAGKHLIAGIFRSFLCFRHYRMSVDPLLPLALIHACSLEVFSSRDTKLCS